MIDSDRITAAGDRLNLKAQKSIQTGLIFTISACYSTSKEKAFGANNTFFFGKIIRVTNFVDGSETELSP